MIRNANSIATFRHDPMSFRRGKPPSLQKAFEAALGELREATDKGDTHQEVCATNHILELAGALAAEDDSPEWALALEAIACEEQGDWQGAEAAYQQKLRLPSLSPSTAYKAHADLGTLYCMLGRPADSLRHSQLGTMAARQADCAFLVIMALGNEIADLHALEDFRNAASLIEEALLLLDGDALENNVRAGLLTQRAFGAVSEGRVSDAEVDLQAALELIEPLARNPMAGGVLGGLASWWGVTTNLRHLKGDGAGATGARETAVSLTRRIASLPHCAGPRVQWKLAMRLQKLADDLKCLGDEARAIEAAAESRIILEAIGLWEYQTRTS